MVLSVLVFVTLVACISDAAGHHITDQVYAKMCDKSISFKEELVQCLSGMPKMDQIILMFCGSVFLNETVEDYNALIDETCKNETYASKVSHCMNHVTHMIYHLSGKSDHHHDDEHDHHHHDDDHHDHHQHDDDHHDHHFDFGHGVYNEECFKGIYKAFNITVSKEDDK